MESQRRTKQRESNNWQASKNLVGCLDHILSSERLADIAIVFPGQGKGESSINAHKLLLAARSPVFESMFFGTESKKSRYIEETDIPPGPFKVLLKYIYTDEADLTPENVLHVLNAAEKYKIPSLTQKCCRHLIPILAPETVCGVLETACMFGLTELQMRCFVYIDEHATKVLSMEGFMKLSRAVMAKIIKRHTLNVTELDVYKAVVAWADMEMKKQKLDKTPENRRKTIGEQFSLIRIPCIPQQQFADQVVKGNLLTGEEVLQIFMQYTASEKKPVKFVDTAPRNPGLVRAERYTSSRDITTACNGGMSGKVNMEVNENMILLGFMVKGFKFKCLFEICALNKIVGHVDFTCGKTKEKIVIDIHCPNATDRHPVDSVYFDRPVLLEKGKPCEMEFNVTFSHETKQIGIQQKDMQMMYSAGLNLKETFTKDNLEVKFPKVSSGNSLPWLASFILAPFSD